MIDRTPTRFGMILRPKKEAAPNGERSERGRNEIVLEFAKNSKPGDRMGVPLLKDDEHTSHKIRRKRWAGAAYWLREKGIGLRVGAITIDGDLYLVNKGMPR